MIEEILGTDRDENKNDNNINNNAEPQMDNGNALYQLPPLSPLRSIKEIEQDCEFPALADYLSDIMLDLTAQQPADPLPLPDESNIFDHTNLWLERDADIDSDDVEFLWPAETQLNLSDQMTTSANTEGQTEANTVNSDLLLSSLQEVLS